jgi:hypothetical protein
MGTLLGLTAGQRAVHLNANGRNGALVRLIERTPDAYILYNQIMFFRVAIMQSRLGHDACQA